MIGCILAWWTQTDYIWPQQTSCDIANEILQKYWDLRTTSYFDHRYYTASYSEAGRCPLRTQSPLIVVISHHPTSVWKPRYVVVPPQSFFVLLGSDVPPFHCPKKENASNSAHGVTIHMAATGCVLHCGCVMQNALYVFPGKRGESDEGNRENLKQRNGNHDNIDTGFDERKIGVTIVQCSHDVLSFCDQNSS